MKQKVLYLDDDAENVMSLVRLFNAKSDELEIVPKHPRRFSDQLEFLKGSLSGYAALILDLRLDQIPGGPNNEAADYRAMSLAQELRTLAFEGAIADLPIFLWTVEKKYNESYRDDDTGHDLFDLSLLKSNFQAHADKYAKKMACFVQAYCSIKDFKALTSHSVFDFLKVSTAARSLIDVRFIARFEDVLEKTPAHTIARFLHRKLIKKEGLLISEPVLASQLGVDTDQSEDWPVLRAMITEAAGYTGPLSEAWARWWTVLVSKWWDENVSTADPLLALPAEDRISLIRDRTKLQGLSAQSPIAPGYSSYYSTICCSLRKPLDPVDGFIIAGVARDPWQQPFYVCGEVLMNRAKYNFDERLEPNEQQRFNALVENNPQ